MKRHFFSGKKFFWLMAAVVLTVSGWPGGASALVQRSDIPKLDRSVSIGKEEFLKKVQLVEETPLGDKSLAFSVPLPLGWKALPSDDQEGVKVSRDLFRQIAQYMGPARLDNRSEFRVRVLELKGMVSAENWFMGYVLANGWTVEGLDTITDRRIEARYTILDRGVDYAVRCVAQISGRRLVMAEYLVPFTYLEEEKDDQAWAMTLFKLTASDLGPMEPVESFAFVDIAKFSYPKAWIFHAPHITTIDRMDAVVTNLKGDDLGDEKENEKKKKVYDESWQMDGRIDVTLVSRMLGTTVPQEVEGLKEKLDVKGLVIGDLIESVSVDGLNDAILQSHIDAYKISSTKLNLIGYEFWVAVLESRGRYYIVRLLTIGRNENFPVWAHNVEVFRYVLRSLSPVNDMN
jgi:hypothetical protein